VKNTDIIAVLNKAMTYLRDMQLRRKDLGIEEKSDATLLTIADKESQRMIHEQIKRQFPDVAFWGEEEGIKGFIGQGRYGAIVDPLDGTNAFVVGLATSTIIIGIYDRNEQRSIACAIGEPITGRIWFADNNCPTTLYCDGEQSFCKTWNGYINNATVFVDVAHGFKSHGRQVLTAKGNVSLHNELCILGAKMLIPGSNGLMQAIVANGCERVYGSITTAIGFPGDVCGELLVRRANGHTIGVVVREDGSLERKDSSDPVALDALICAGSKEGAEKLFSAFERAQKLNMA